jgi:hypothetical protein
MTLAATTVFSVALVSQSVILRIDTNERDWLMIANSGSTVEIRGPCVSACTLVMAYVPRERICFGVSGKLMFHAAREFMATEPSLKGTQWMIDRYPQDIRTWIENRGGAEKMTINEYWILEAKELWAMGYQRCKIRR